MFKELTKEEEEIGCAVVNTAYLVHKELGLGLLEKNMFFHLLRI